MKGENQMDVLTNMKSLQDAFNSMSYEVLLNDKPQQAMVTQAHLGVRSRG